MTFQYPAVSRRNLMKSVAAAGLLANFSITPLSQAVAAAMDDMETVRWTSCVVNCGSRCPLKAIVVLRQGKKNHLVRLVGAQAATILLSECMVPLWDRIATQRVMDTVTQVVEQCPIYLYHCLPDASAVEHLYHVIYEGGKPDE